MQEVRKQAIRLLDAIRSSADQPNDPHVQSLKSEAQKAIDLCESGRGAQSVEDQAKRIKSLVQSGLPMSVMSPQDVDDLKDRCDDIIEAARKAR
jgi:translation initiation factor 2B subunit (eIF-2B alpha/beta/delta family)